MEEHELISVSYVEGRASKVRPGKPVFRYAFEALVQGESFFSLCLSHFSKWPPGVAIVSPLR